MFSGIVEGTGTVVSAQHRGDVLDLRIEADFELSELSLGASIAVDGCCLTALRASGRAFSCDLTEETLQRTGFDQRLMPGALVNLERPLRADGRFDGHIVQGHVDGLGVIRELRSLGESAELKVLVPAALARYLVEKGSVALDGISLTVAHLGDSGPDGQEFTVALIPHTIEVTNLRAARPGDRVNVEVDVIAKYVERLLAAHGDERRERTAAGGV